MFVIFNGAPNTGKDHASSYAKENFGFKHISFKTQLYYDVQEVFSLNKAEFADFMLHYNDRNVKEKPIDYLDGKSRREAMIYSSEDVMKKRHGLGYYGEKIAEEMEQGYDYCASDGGFVEEVQAIVDRYIHGKVAIVQIFRRGCDHRNDSRRYIQGNVVKQFGEPFDISDQLWTEDKVDVDVYQIFNGSTAEDFDKSISNVIRWIKENERKHI